MKNIFRWGGLIGFVVFTALVFIIGFFFIDNWAKKAIEAAGLSVNGAQVDIANVDLSLSPVGFDIKGIEIADAAKPTHNALQIGRAKLDISLAQLFLGNIRINNLELFDVQSDVQRSRVAKVQLSATQTVANKAGEAAGEAKGALKNKAAELGAALPKPESILQQSTANTREAVAKAKTSLQQSSDSIQNAFNDIPTDKDIKNYQQRMAKIEANKLQSLEEIKAMSELLRSLGKDVAADKQAIASAKQSINTAVADSKVAINQVAQAPNKDWQQLKQDYPLDKSSAIKVAELLLGEQFFNRIQQANEWYTKAKPWLARLQGAEGEAEESAPAVRAAGAYIRFPHPDPSAKLQMDRGELFFQLDGRPWLLEISNLVSGPSRLIKPLGLLLKRGETDNGFTVDGEMKIVDDVNIDTFVLSGSGIDFAKQSAKVAGTALTWEPDKANIQGEIVSTDGQLGGQVVLDFPANTFEVDESDSNARYLKSVLAKVTRFNVTVDLGGKVQRPNLKVSSTLDNQISTALQNVVKEEYQQWLAGMQQNIRSKGDNLKAPLDTSLAGLNKKKVEAEAKIARFEKEVESELKALEAKLLNKQKALENKLKSESEKQKNKLKDSLKDKAGTITDKFKR